MCLHLYRVCLSLSSLARGIISAGRLEISKASSNEVSPSKALFGSWGELFHFIKLGSIYWVRNLKVWGYWLLGTLVKNPLLKLFAISGSTLIWWPSTVGNSLSECHNQSEERTLSVSLRVPEWVFLLCFGLSLTPVWSTLRLRWHLSLTLRGSFGRLCYFCIGIIKVIFQLL